MKRVIIFILLFAVLAMPMAYAEGETVSPVPTATDAAEQSPALSPSEVTLVPVEFGSVALYVGIAIAVAAAGCGVYFYLRKVSEK